MNLTARIEAAITEASGEAARFARSRTAFGGCISDGRVVALEDGREFFVKVGGGVRTPTLFACEFEALQLLAAAAVIRVPRPLCYDRDFIVMEAFDPGCRRADWLELMGRQLASLHKATQTTRYGFPRDNYLGSTLQPNGWSGDWVTFWREQRLGWQLHLFAGKTGADDPLLSLGDRLLTRLDAILGDVDEPAVLLHGDLWSGNADADEAGRPIIFDPASYYGQREAEIGMMRLFGGFGPVCEAAYNEVWPFAPGSEQRIPLYRLYHELNHLNLFGRSYYEGCLATLRSLL